MKNLKVSVVIPAYNHEKYVGEAIQSVLDQTFQDLELIIINDGSTDNTETEILKFKDERIRYFSQENRGLSATLNRGIELARGEYFNFLPSDDAFFPEKLATQLKAFEESKEIGVVFSYHLVVGGEGKEVKDDPIVDWFTVPFETKEEIFPALFERDFLSAPTALIKMECFEKAGRFDESLKTAQDYDMWMRILKYYDLRLIKRPLLRYRWHGANLTYQATPETELERAKVLLKAYNNLKIEDIFPSLHQRKDAFAYAEAYEKLATYIEKSGVPALLLISEIYRDRGRYLTEKKEDLFLFKREDGEESEEGFYQGGSRGDSRKIHLLIETRALDKGGLEEVIYGIATHLDPDLFLPVVVCIEAGGFTADRVRKAGIPVEVLGEEKEKEYIEILNRYRIDLVNTHYSFFGSAIAYRKGIPVISVLHNLYSWYSGGILKEFRVADLCVSKYIAVSKQVASFFEYRFNIERSRIEIIPDGIDLGKFAKDETQKEAARRDLGFDEGDFVFLHVGAITPAKMQNLLVAVMKEISKNHPKIKLISLGPELHKDYGSFIRMKIEEAHLGQNVKLIGFVENPSSYYRVADAFVLPSLIEGWGISTLEAMYHGLPLILTKVGGAEELVENQDVGILIENCCDDLFQLSGTDLDYYSHLDFPKNAPELIEAMLNIYWNREEWKKKAKAGKRKVISHYTWNYVISQYEKEFIDSALEGGKRREVRLSEFLRHEKAQLVELEVRLGDHLKEREEQKKVIEDQSRIIQNQAELARLQQLRLEEQGRKLEDQRKAIEGQSGIIQNQVELSRLQQVQLEEQVRERDRLLAEREQFLRAQEGMLKEMSQRLQKGEEKIDEMRRLIDSRYQQLDQHIDYVVRRLSIGERLKERALKLLKTIHKLVPKKFREKYRSQYRRFFFDRVFPDGKKLGTDVAGNSQVVCRRNPIKIPSGIDFFVFPIIDWELRYQRPQQIAERLANQGNRIFYFRITFVEASNRTLSPADISSMIKIEEYKENIYLITLVSHKTYNVYRDSLDDELSLKYLLNCLNGLKERFQIKHTVSIVDLPFWLPLVAQLPDNKMIYDCMDDHEGFSTNTKKMVNHEEELIRGADLILTSSQLLFQKASKINKNTVMVKNAADIAHFSNLPESDVLEHINRPIIGYYGAISDWFDTQLISGCAKAYPEYSFVLIGSTFNADLGPFEGLKNVYLMGEIPYKDLPKYLGYFDVCMIPFKMNPLTQAANPVKFYEYLSTGKPVVTTALQELSPYKEICYFSDNEQEFVANIKRALSERNEAIKESRIRLARENSWDHRVEQILELTKTLFPKISIVLITYNNLEYTKSCVESIFSYSRYPNLQLIVVDNHSQDGTIEYLRELQSRKSNVQVIFNQENKGFAGGNNVGLKVADGEYIVFLNNDTVVTPDWLYVLMSILQKNPRLGMIGPVSNAVWNVQKIQTTYQTMVEMHQWAEDYTSQQPDDYRAVNMLGFFCLMTKREVFEEVGLLDENYKIGFFEDDDYCRRVMKAGYEIGYTKKVFIHHSGSASFNRLESREYEEIWSKNKMYFEKKWGIEWSNDLTEFRTLALKGGTETIRMTDFYQFQINKILKNNHRRVFIFYPVIEWNTPVFQRPHQIALGLSRSGHLVFFFTENQKYDKIDELLEVRDHLYLIDEFDLLRKIGGNEITYVIYSTNTKTSYADLEEAIKEGKKVLYEYIDEIHEAITEDVLESVMERHKRILGNEAFFVVAATDKLYQEVSRYRTKRCALVTNGVDIDHFRKEMSVKNIPEEIAPIVNKGKPIIGYYGPLSKWLDYELVMKLCQKRPDYEILLIGYPYENSLARGDFRQYSNLSIIGPVDYRRLPEYASWFDVTTIPFKLNEITESTSPINLFEYMAMGHPIVTMDMPECRKYRSVLIGEDHEDFIRKVDKALTLKQDKEYGGLLKKEAMENSWESKVRLITELLGN
jgi:GT2 family glycosyltransferase/glycosyltransferase involved in cell wall biosynthesis